MTYYTPIGGPIQVVENPDSTNVTGPQIHSVANLWDSRLERIKRNDPTYDEIRELQKDPTVALLREAVVAPAIHTPWTIEETDRAPRGAKELIEDIFYYHRVNLISSSLLNAMDFGWAPFETVWEMKRGRAVITKFKQLIHDYTWILVYLDTGAFAGLTNRPWGATWEVILPNIQSLNVNLEVEGTDWYGKSVMRVIAGIQDDWDLVNNTAARYDKKVAGATWVVFYPVGTTDYNGEKAVANDQIAKDVLSKLEASGSVAIPDEIQEFIADDIDEETKGKWRVELISATSTSYSSFIDRSKYLDNLKARAFGIPERSIFEGSFGTKAEAEAHADIAISTIDTKHRKIVKQINHGAVNDVLRVNFGERAENTVFIQVAPLIDARIGLLRELYRLIIQNPDLVQQEVSNMDLEGLRNMIGIPSTDARQAE